jgi:hypothetical protein
MGIFSGRLQFTVCKGTDLLRQEAIARTDEPDAECDRLCFITEKVHASRQAAAHFRAAR